MSNTPFFPKKLPIVLIATLATLFLTAGFITTGELLAGNVYRAGGVVIELTEDRPAFFAASADPNRTIAHEFGRASRGGACRCRAPGRPCDGAAGRNYNR